ncbi:MAG: 4'-phosphopantetheinyl transferase superfamily protein [Lachnospiraceae bacterium]|nr:4'-phosphopantetheinyl transferase superfamily protein [Lachnospiraceae bacterium]
MEVRFYRTDLLDKEKMREHAERLLREEGWGDRVEKAARLRYPRDAKLCLCAGLALRDVLEARGVPDRKLLADPNGKLYLEGREDLFFNLSHSGLYAVCAAGDDPVGIDVQKITRASEGFLDRWYTKREKGLVLSCGEPDRMFTRIWTIKEAYMKMTGLGLRIPPEKLEVTFPLTGREAGREETREELCGWMDLSESAARIRTLGTEIPEVPCVILTGELGEHLVSVCAADQG